MSTPDPIPVAPLEHPSPAVPAVLPEPTTLQLDALGRMCWETYAASPRNRAADLPSWERLLFAQRLIAQQFALQLWRALDTLGWAIYQGSPPEPHPRESDWAAITPLLAELLHLRWLHRRTTLGWHLGARTDPAARLSRWLVPWPELPEGLRENECAQVAAFPGHLAALGFQLGFHPALFGLLEAAPPNRFGNPEAPLAVLNLPLLVARNLTVSTPQNQPEDADIEPAAEALHEAYVRHGLAHGDTLSANSSLRPWKSLPEFLRNSNRGTTRKLWTRFQIIGLLPVRQSDPRPSVPTEEFAHCIEPLAALNHAYWRHERLVGGWLYAPPPKNPVARTHPSLCPWAELPAQQQAIDHDQVRTAEAVLRSAGWRIVRVDPMGSPDPLLRED